MACLEGLATEENRERVQQLNLEVCVQCDDIPLDNGLMERYFGRLDGDYLYTYSYVWPVDMFDSTHKAFDVESVAEVSKRTGEAVQRIDAHVSKRTREGNGNGDSTDTGQDSNSIVVLTSHADTLQILQLYAAGSPNVGKFSSYRFMNGEVRAMKRTTDSLPEPVPMKPPNDS
jgi:broad specificity phosphatase PhoE